MPARWVDTADASFWLYRPPVAQPEPTDLGIGVVDQSHLVTAASQGFNYLGLKSYLSGQEFTPTAPVLTGVDVHLATVTRGGDDTITVNIRKGNIENPVLATASQSVPEGFDGLKHFDFPSPLIVTPGDTYILQVQATKPTHAWSGTSAATRLGLRLFQSEVFYPGGRAIVFGRLAEDSDMLFQTYTGQPTLNLIREAPLAAWTSDSGRIILPWEGSDTDQRGYVNWRYNLLLEDGSKPERVLQTHPQWVDEGNIIGDFTLPGPIQAGDRFKAQVGFLAGAGGEVEFVVEAWGGTLNSIKRVVGITDGAKDGALRMIDVDLSPVQGATVIAGTSSWQDWAVWKDARIEH
jgi:hypothetical protein